MLYGTAPEPRHQIRLDVLPDGGYLAAALAAAAVIRVLVRGGAPPGTSPVVIGNYVSLLLSVGRVG